MSCIFGAKLRLPNFTFHKPLYHLIGFKIVDVELMAIGLIKVIDTKFIMQIMTDRQTGCIFEVTLVKKHYFHCNPMLNKC